MKINSIKIFVFILSLLLLSQVIAEEKINGAFGIKLGQPFDPNTAIGEASLTDGTPMYQFSPEKKFRSFSRYYVLITPKSHKVYAIWGIGDIENTEICKKEQDLLMTILSDKYGEKNEEDLFSSLYDSEMIIQGNRYVMTKCTGLMDISVEIRYKDNEYEKLAENERIEIESKKLDSSGL